VRVISLITLCYLFILPLGSLLSAQDDFIGINCGNVEFPVELFFGEEYLADHPWSDESGSGYIGGHTETVRHAEITYDVESGNMLTYWLREGEFSYRFDLNPGDYLVKLRLMEAEYHGPGFRTFSVVIEGDTVINEIDIYEQFGRAYALMFRFVVECEDGTLDIDFMPGTEEATCCAIGVQRITEDETAPSTPEWVDAIDGYNMNFLLWQWNSAEDLLGFRLHRQAGNNAWEVITPDLLAFARYRDYDVRAGRAYRYKVEAVDAWGNVSEQTESSRITTLDHDDSELPVYEFSISDADLHQMNTDIWSENYTDVNIEFENRYFDGAGVRYRGAFTRELSKKNFRFRLPDGETFNTRDRIALVSEMRDVTMLREYFASQLFILNNCLTPETDFIHLVRNDEFLGVYTEVEALRNDFLMRRGLSPEGNFYKAISNLGIEETEDLYRQKYEKLNNEDTDWQDLIEFIEWLNLSSDDEFLEQAAEWFELDDFLDVYVAEVVIANRDFTIQNYCLYNNPVSSKWHFIPFDLNTSFIDPYMPVDISTTAHPDPIFDTLNVLFDRTLNIPLFRYAYSKKLERFVNSHFSIGNLTDIIDDAYRTISFDAVRDVYKPNRERRGPFQTGPDSLNTFVRERSEYILDTIPQFIPEVDLSPWFRMNELQTVNGSTIWDEQGEYEPWIEIYNHSPVELDLEGFILRSGVESWTLPVEAVIPTHGFLLLWLDGEENDGVLHSDFEYENGDELILENSDGEETDRIDPPELTRDQVWARDGDGNGEWEDDLAPTPGVTNTPAWDVSLLVINEFLALNTNSNTDDAGEYEDWIELFNPSPVPLNIQGLYLTDDLEEPDRWALPDTTIPSNDFLLIWCDGEPEEGVLHSPFRLRTEGEHAGLFDADGMTPIDMILFDLQQADISFGRSPDGSDDWGVMSPTPGSTNELATGVLNNIEKEYRVTNPYLEPAAPNPFNATTKIRFFLPIHTDVKLIIYDILGREVITLVNSNLATGWHTVQFKAKNYASGLYFCRMEAGTHFMTRKLILLK